MCELNDISQLKKKKLVQDSSVFLEAKMPSKVTLWLKEILRSNTITSVFSLVEIKKLPNLFESSGFIDGYDLVSSA